jgi:hypothetical protein
MYDDVVRIEQGEQVVVSYPCVYDPRQRRITAVDARGRQQYGPLPVLQLVLWALALERTVWRMPRYHRTPPPRRVLLTLQMKLLPPFTNEIVQIRIEDPRTLHCASAIPLLFPLCPITSWHNAPDDRALSFTKLGNAPCGVRQRAQSDDHAVLLDCGMGGTHQRGPERFPSPPCGLPSYQA